MNYKLGSNVNFFCTSSNRNVLRRVTGTIIQKGYGKNGVWIQVRRERGRSVIVFLKTIKRMK